jgi:hypothetical protein
LPLVVVRAAWEQHLRLEAHEAARHVEIIGGLIESQLVNGLEELIGDAADRDVRDLDLVFAEQVQQQIERTRERFELDDESRSRTQRGGGRESVGERRGASRPLDDPADLVRRDHHYEQIPHKYRRIE